MVPLIITLLQWEFVVTTMVIFFSVSKKKASKWIKDVHILRKRHGKVLIF